MFLAVNRDCRHPELGGAFLEGWGGLEKALPEAALARVEAGDQVAQEAPANLETRGFGNGLEPVEQVLGRRDPIVEKGILQKRPNVGQAFHGSVE